MRKIVLFESLALLALMEWSKYSVVSPEKIITKAIKINVPGGAFSKKGGSMQKRIYSFFPSHLILPTLFLLVGCFSSGQQQQESMDELDVTQGENSEDFQQNQENNQALAESEGMEGEEDELENVINLLNKQGNDEYLADGDVLPGQPHQLPVPEELSSEGMIGGFGGKTVGDGLPEMGSKIPYIVRVGDSLSRISQKIYGTTKKWKELANLTGMKNPNVIYPGDIVYYRLAENSLAFARKDSDTQKDKVIVKKGDTLAGIAKRVYGNKAYWRVIWRNNSHISNPDTIEVGMKLSVYNFRDLALNETNTSTTDQQIVVYTTTKTIDV